MAVLSDGIWFLVVLIDIPPVITTDVEHLVLWLVGLGFFLSFFYLER